METRVDPLTAPVVRIGEWLFAPGANELCRGDERRKLEHRAARTLELLCRRRGAIVSQEEIVGEVWNGRAISPNSVPVVISDLRQALGDDARRPQHIETVSKRGYRLIGEAAEATAPAESRARPQRRSGIAIIAILLLVAVILYVALSRSQARYTPLIVADVVNATGSPGYQPLADATSEVIIANAQKMPGVEAFRNGPPREGAITLESRLIIWTGRPMVMMSATAPGGAVIWTGMTSGTEDMIPQEVAAAISQLSVKLQPPASG